MEAGESPRYCNGCGTPHHEACYTENGGCTVFGCRFAPAEEPKIQVLAPELAGPGIMAAQLPVAAAKAKSTYVLLGVLLGAFGAHNFYAGYRTRALAQLAITVVTVGYGSPFSWVWAIIEVCTNDRDSQGVQFVS
jgi:hypothetical protein